MRTSGSKIAFMRLVQRAEKALCATPISEEEYQRLLSLPTYKEPSNKELIYKSKEQEQKSKSKEQKNKEQEQEQESKEMQLHLTTSP